jgi:hypothetical protein
MAIASISGSSSSVPVRTSMEPIRGVKAESEKKPAETLAVQENEDKNDKNGKKANLDAKKQEELKGVKEVDTRA